MSLRVRRLSRFAGAAFVNDTILAVADGMEGHIVFISPLGREIAVFGRKGEGPGEFRNIRRVSAKSDTIVAFDATLRRALLFHPQAGFVRSVSAPAGLSALLAGDTRLVAIGGGRSTSGSSGPSLWYDTLQIRLVNARGQSRTIGKAADRTRIGGLAQGLGIIDAPFSPIPSVVANHDFIVVGDGSGTITRFSAAGQRASALKSPFNAEPVTAADFARWVEHGIAGAEADSRAGLQKLYQVAKAPARAPAHGAIAMDRQSVVWIQEYRTPYDTRVAGIAALDRAGRLISRGQVPANVQLLAASPAALAFVAKDALDTEVVLIFGVVCN